MTNGHLEHVLLAAVGAGQDFGTKEDEVSTSPVHGRRCRSAPVHMRIHKVQGLKVRMGYMWDPVDLVTTIAGKAVVPKINTIETRVNFRPIGSIGSQKQVPSTHATISGARTCCLNPLVASTEHLSEPKDRNRSESVRCCCTSKHKRCLTRRYCGQTPMFRKGCLPQYLESDHSLEGCRGCQLV